MAVIPLNEWQQVGTHDLRAEADNSGGFSHILLRDADDGDQIVINEDDIRPLRDYLERVIKERGL